MSTALATVAPDFYVLELSSFQLETTHSLNARVSDRVEHQP
jgi:UDP-N-acetylmuramoylalanine-D-glutamate ligase